MTPEEIRKCMADIRADPTLTPQEKGRRYQALLSAPSRKKPKEISNCDTHCPHYEKQCSRFDFSCCGIIDPCRRCHMARKTCQNISVVTITCNQCHYDQPPATNCANCGIQFAKNHCVQCSIWTAADITHCDACGLCRVGTPDELFHCFTCGVCFDKRSQSTHRCASSNLQETNCVYCFDPIHNSQTQSSILQCGHAVHEPCLKTAMANRDYRCPVCRKAVCDMSRVWAEIRYSIAVQPMRIPRCAYDELFWYLISTPLGVIKIDGLGVSEYAGDESVSGELVNWTLTTGQHPVILTTADYIMKHGKYVVETYCNDCDKSGISAFHYLGLECAHCGGFNTTRQ